MQKYNFQGKDTSEKEFWRLCSLAKLEEIEKELYGEYDHKVVQKLLVETRVKKEQTISTPKCQHCGSRMILNNAHWGKYWHCSDAVNCFSIQLI